MKILNESYDSTWVIVRELDALLMIELGKEDTSFLRLSRTETQRYTSRGSVQLMQRAGASALPMIYMAQRTRMWPCLL